MPHHVGHVQPHHVGHVTSSNICHMRPHHVGHHTFSHDSTHCHVTPHQFRQVRPLNVSHVTPHLVCYMVPHHVGHMKLCHVCHVAPCNDVTSYLSHDAICLLREVTEHVMWRHIMLVKWGYAVTVMWRHAMFVMWSHFMAVMCCYALSETVRSGATAPKTTKCSIFPSFSMNFPLSVCMCVIHTVWDSVYGRNRVKP